MGGRFLAVGAVVALLLGGGCSDDDEADGCERLLEELARREPGTNSESAWNDIKTLQDDVAVTLFLRNLADLFGCS